MPNKEFTVSIFGPEGSGKTKLRERLTHGEFDRTYQKTVGVDFGRKTYVSDSIDNVVLKIWDTAGAEQFQSLGKAYGPMADAVLLTISLDPNGESLVSQTEKLKNQLKNLGIKEGARIYLVPTQADTLKGISEAELAKIQESLQGIQKTLQDATGRKIQLTQATSAKDGQNVEQVFKTIKNDVQKPLPVVANVVTKEAPKSEAPSQPQPQGLSTNTKIAIGVGAGSGVAALGVGLGVGFSGATVGTLAAGVASGIALGAATFGIGLLVAAIVVAGVAAYKAYQSSKESSPRPSSSGYEPVPHSHSATHSEPSHSVQLSSSAKLTEVKSYDSSSDKPSGPGPDQDQPPPAP